MTPSPFLAERSLSLPDRLPGGDGRAEETKGHLEGRRRTGDTDPGIIRRRHVEHVRAETERGDRR